MLSVRYSITKLWTIAVQLFFGNFVPENSLGQYRIGYVFLREILKA